MKLRKLTKSFGFLFDNFRKIGDTFPLDKVEFRDFVIGQLLKWVPPRLLQKAKSKIGSAEHNYYINSSDKLTKRLIHTYGEEAADALFTISVNLISKKLKLTSFDYNVITYHLVSDVSKFSRLINSIYEDVKSRPMNELTRSIGTGITGIALPDSGIFNDSNSIIKKFPGGIPEVSRKFYEYCRDHESQCLVRVHEVGNDFVKMQKLNVGSLKCVKFIDEVNQVIHFQYQNKGKVPKFAKLGTLAWINDINKMCEALHISISQLDLHEGNVGEDENGDVILFDPIGPDLDQKADSKRLDRYQKIIQKWRKKSKH